MNPSLSLRVREVRFLADRIFGLTMVDPNGDALPPWTPGAHIDLQLPSGVIRSYSLCGNPSATHEYQIAVLRADNGRGGSAEIHDTQLVGKTLLSSLPRNTFEMEAASHYVFIAGGIGITPLLTMARALTARGVTWEMHYLGRSRETMAFISEMTTLAGNAKTEVDRVTLDIVARDEGRRCDIATCIATAPAGSAIYCCGPESLLQAVEAAHHPDRTIHLERFGRPALAPLANIPPGVASDVEGPAESALDDLASPCDPDGSFDVVLQRSSVTVRIPAGQSILEIVRQTRRDLTFSCSSGYCGTCETRVLEGIPDHRDEVLSPEEREANTSMMICVSRSCRSKLVLDL